MIRWFEIEDVNKGAARFDFQKLEALNGVHMRQMDDAELLDIFVAHPALSGERQGDRSTGWTTRRKAQLLAAMPGLKERAKTLVELADGAAFLFAERPLVARREGGGAARPTAAQDVLARRAQRRCKAVDGDWNAAAAEAAIREFAAAEGPEARRGRAAAARRADRADSTSPGVFDVLAVLGREESLARIGDQID